MVKAEEKNKEKKTSKASEPDKESQILDLLKTVVEGQNAFDKRLIKIETSGRDNFKEGVKAEDVEAAGSTRAGVDERITKIVDEILGEDFGVKIETLPDRPGFRFSLLVPVRLSDKDKDQRPIINPKIPGQYLKDKAGNVVMEDYYPDDKRSLLVGSSENFDAIRKHCERVRSYIVAYFQKVSKPLPDFKVK